MQFSVPLRQFSLPVPRPQDLVALGKVIVVVVLPWLARQFRPWQFVQAIAQFVQVAPPCACARQLGFVRMQVCLSVGIFHFPKWGFRHRYRARISKSFCRRAVCLAVCRSPMPSPQQGWQVWHQSFRWAQLQRTLVEGRCIYQNCPPSIPKSVLQGLGCSVVCRWMCPLRCNFHFWLLRQKIFQCGRFCLRGQFPYFRQIYQLHPKERTW